MSDQSFPSELVLLAAGAPAVPDWFVPVLNSAMPDQPKLVQPPRPQGVSGNYERDMKFIKGGVTGDAAEVLEKYPFAEGFIAAWVEFWERARAYEAEYRQERLLQWPVYYAREVIARLEVAS